MFGLKKLRAQISGNDNDLSRWYKFFSEANHRRYAEITALQEDVKLLRAELASRPVMIAPAELAKLKEAAARNQLDTAALANARHDLLFPNQNQQFQSTDGECPAPPRNKIDIGN